MMKTISTWSFRCACLISENMYIINIELRNFRNYTHLNLDFSKHKNLIIGENAQGKTNLLESIYFCCFGKSFRNHNDGDLIRKDADFFKINLSFFKNHRTQEIEIIVKNDKLKQIKKNGVKLKNIKELFGSLNIVFFSPDDLKLIKASPLDRRKFIDREISNIYSGYINHLIEYNKVLGNRNALLKNFKNIYYSNSCKISDFMRTQAEIWDVQLASHGVKIMQKRFEFIKKLSDGAKYFHNRISSQHELLRLFYESSLDEQNKNLYGEYISCGKFDLREMEELFIDKLRQSLENDIKYGSTKYGIHKDDLGFEINDFDAKKFASQGQQRTAILAMKMAQIKVVKDIINDDPVLLLDDVMSELDLKRQAMLLNMIEDFQCMISTTDLSAIKMEDLDYYKKIIVKNGRISCNEGGSSE